MKTSKSLPVSFPIVMVAVIFLLAEATSAFAVSATWTGASDANWSAAGNWSGSVPGATVGGTNTDTATFSASTPLNGTALTPVVIDSGRNIKNITFDGSAAPYVIGSTSGNALLLTATGTIQIAATKTSAGFETINAPLILAGNYTFANNSPTLSSALQFNGSITGTAGSTVTLTLDGSNANPSNIISGVISPGSGGTLAITKIGAGYWDITGNNSSLTGTTTISGGTLSIGNANALGSGSIVLNGGGGTLAADSNVTISNVIYQGTYGTAFPLQVGGSHSITDTGTSISGIVTSLIFNGATTNPSVFFNNMTGTATFTVTGATILANSTSVAGQVYFAGAGNTSLSDIAGGTGSGGTNPSLLYKYGTGTLTLNGVNYATGTENFLGGTVIANENGSGAGSLLGYTPYVNPLTLGANLILSGSVGSNKVETVNGTTIAGSTGTLSYQASISASAGSGNTINLGTLGNPGTSLVNFQPGVAYTTTGSGAQAAPNTGNTGVYGGWALAGNGVTEDFAANLAASGTNAAIVALPTYDYALSNGTFLAQGVALVANASGHAYSDTNTTNIGITKFDTSNGTAAGSYSFGRTTNYANFFGSMNFLYTGPANYTIAGPNALVQDQVRGGGNATGNIYIEQYGTGTFTISDVIIGATSANYSGNVLNYLYSGAKGTLVKGGPGTLVLSAANNYIGNTLVDGGTLSISSDTNLGGLSGTLTVNATVTATTTATITGSLTQSLVGASFLGSTIISQSAPVSNITTLTLASAVTAGAGTYSYANGQQLIELNGGTLQATSSFTLGETNGTVSNYRPITLGVNGGTIDVTGTNTLIAPGVISQTSGGVGQLGGVNGVATLTKIDSGTLVLTGTSTYLGGTIVNGGTLKLDFAATGVSNFTSPTANILASAGALTLGGGTLSINGTTTSTADTQTLASLALSGGANTISETLNGASSVGLIFTNGSIARTAGSTIDFVTPTNTSVTLTGIPSNAFLGNYAFFGSGTSEGYAATGSTGAVQAASLTPATGVNNFTSATANYAYTSPGTPDTLTGNATANTAVFSTAGAQTIDLGANTLTLNGFLNDNGALTIQSTGGAGSLVIGSTNELVIGGSSNVNISAAITGAGAGLTDSNTGTLNLSGSNTYSGATIINSGALVLSGGTINGSSITTNGSSIFSQTGGVIAGSGVTFTQASTGTSTLAGTNTFTGLTTVSNGELDLNTTAAQALAGNLTVTGGIAKLLQANQISPTGSLSVTGGTFNIQNFNQVLGGVQLIGGTITGTTTGTLYSSSTFDIQGGVASANLGGSVGLTMTGANSVILSGTNTYTGTTTISSGTLYTTNITAAGPNNLGNAVSAIVLGSASTTGTLSYTGATGTFTRGFTVNAGGGEIDSSSAGTLTIATGNINDTAGGVIIFGGTGNTTVTSNIVAGSAALTNNSFGTVVLSGANTFTGLTTLDIGTLNLGSKGALGTGNITFNGGTLQYSNFNQVDFSSKIINSNSVGPISIDTNGQSVTFASNLASSNVGGLTKLGAGNLILSGTNTYAGTTTVTAGTLSFSNNNNLGSATSAISLGAADLSYTGLTGTFTRGIALTVAGAEIDTTTAGQTLTIGTTNITGAFNSVFGGAGNTTVTSVIATGAGSVTKLGSGTLLVTNTDTYTGATIVDSGIFQVGNGTTGKIGTTAVTFNGGTLNLNEAAGSTQALGALTFTAGDGTVQSTYGGSGTSTTTFASLAARAAGATGNFVLSGSGSTAANNLINITGATAGQELGVGEFFNGSNYAVVNAANGPVRGMIYTGTPDTGATQNTGGTTAASSTYLQVTGSLTAQATGTFTGINLSGTPGIALAGGAVLSVDGLLKSGTGASTISGGASIKSVAANDEFVIRTDLASDSLTISTPILANGANALTKSGAGTLTLSGSNTYTGVTTIDGGTLSAGNVASGGSLGTGTLTINGGLLSYTGATGTFTRAVSIAGAGGEIDTTTSGQTLTIGTAGLVTSNQGLATFGGAGNTTVTSVISGNGGVLDKSTGTVSFSGLNTYTGNTTINSGSTLAITGAGYLQGGFYAGNISDSGTFSYNSSAAQLISGQISGTGTLTAAGTGTLTLSGSNTYSGGTVINSSGVVEFAGPSAMSSTGTVTANSGGTLALAVGGAGGYSTATSGASSIGGIFSGVGGQGGAVVLNSGSSVGLDTTGGNVTYAGNISNSGVGLTKLGANILTLSGSNSYSGGTTISAGILEFATANSMSGNSTVTATSGSTLALGSGFTNATSGAGSIGGVFSGVGGQGGAVVLNSGSAVGIDTTAASVTYGGNITNAGVGLTKLGTNSLILTGTNTYTGATTISGGTLQLGNGTTKGTLATTSAITNNSNFAINYSGTVNQSTDFGTISGIGSVTQSGTGTTILTNANTYSGGTSVSAGTLIASNSTGSATGSGALTEAFGATMSGTGTINSSSNVINGTILAGPGGTSTSGTLNLLTTGITTFSSTANLAFNLASTSGVDNQLNVGSSTVLFQGSTLTLNLVNSGTTNYTNGSTYILVDGTSNSQYSGLTLSGTNIIGGLTLNLTGTATNGASNAVYYGNSFLFLNNGDIEVQVVPEPGTWALMLGGLAMLVIVQIRRRPKH